MDLQFSKRVPCLHLAPSLLVFRFLKSLVQSTVVAGINDTRGAPGVAAKWRFDSRCLPTHVFDVARAVEEFQVPEEGQAVTWDVFSFDSPLGHECPSWPGVAP